MNTPLTLTKLLLCAGFMAAAATASAGINRCVDAQGAVLLTDAECPQGSRVADEEVSDSGADGIVLNSGVARLLPAAPVAQQSAASLPRSRWADLPHPVVRKIAGPDALTLQAARSTMQMQDEVRRQGRVASR